MKKRIKSLLFPTITILLIISSVLLLNSKWNNQIESYNSLLEANQKEMEDMRKSQEILKQNSTQVRQYMNLSPLRFDDQEEDPPKGSAENFELAAYDAVAFLQDYTHNQEKLREFHDHIESSKFENLKKKLNLEYTGTASYKGVLKKNKNLYFSLEYKADEDLFLVQAKLGDYDISGKIESKSVDRFITDQTKRMDDLYNKLVLLNSNLLQLYHDVELKKSLSKLNLRFSESGMSGNSRYLPVLRIDDSELLRVTTDPLTEQYLLNDRSYPDLESLKKGILDFISHQDIRTDSQIFDDKIQDEVKQLLKDPAFNARLKELGFHSVMKPREDNDYIYYDILDDNSSRQGSLALQKDFGEIYLMDGDDVPIRSLKTFSNSHDIIYNFQTEAPESIAPDQDLFIPAQGSETFLLIGAHEHNADTMILLHCDSDSSEIRMLSIPRDLYYEGRKINSIYREYGPMRLASELSSLTGLSITKYVAIDMYAFIDVVNILGGIDVTLDEALVDPTYKVKENGKWSTLYYPKGTHHLDGIAALRIARSRHTSSDFVRSVRQQNVIASLKNKVGNMGFSDMNKIYELIQTTGKYVRTNLSTAEMVKYFLSYKDFSMAGQNVMNTDNILYATYTNLYRLTEEEQKKALEDPAYNKGGWIVLPKDNDWSIIKTYIRSVLTKS